MQRVMVITISCMRGGTYWRQWLRSSLASFEWSVLFGTLVQMFQINHLTVSIFSQCRWGRKGVPQKWRNLL